MFSVLDLKKGFDTVNHKILLRKGELELEFYFRKIPLHEQKILVVTFPLRF